MFIRLKLPSRHNKTQRPAINLLYQSTIAPIETRTMENGQLSIKNCHEPQSKKMMRLLIFF
jgi:hypothetical protein